MSTVAPERSLFDPRDWDIQQRFEAFDRAHPEVWRMFKLFANQLLAAGHEHYSADAILHRIRWEHAINRAVHDASDGGLSGGFKINDHFSSRYGRKLAAAEPARFGGFFEFRRLHA